MGEQSSKGVELAARAAPHARWQLGGNLRCARRRVTRTLCKAAFRWLAKTPTNTPQTVANLWVSYAPLTPTWTASAGVRHVGKVCQCRQHATLARHTLLDLGVAWKLRPTTH